MSIQLEVETPEPADYVVISAEKDENGNIGIIATDENETSFLMVQFKVDGKLYVRNAAGADDLGFVMDVNNRITVVEQ